MEGGSMKIRMRLALIIVKTILLLLLPISSFAFDKEPDGFRDIKWGTDIETLKDMKFKGDYESSKIYTRENDRLRVGVAEVDSVEYFFWKGKFHEVDIKAYKNKGNLYVETFATFGEGSPSVVGFKWKGLITTIYLNIFDDHTTLRMLSTEIESKKVKEDKGF